MMKMMSQVFYGYSFNNSQITLLIGKKTLNNLLTTSGSASYFLEVKANTS